MIIFIIDNERSFFTAISDEKQMVLIKYEVISG